MIDHSQHGTLSPEVQKSHDKHAGHNVSDFWKRFIICSIVSMPVLALSHMIGSSAYEFKHNSGCAKRKTLLD